MSDPTNRDGQAYDAEGAQPHQSAEDASTSVVDHDEHHGLVEDAPTQQLPTQGDAPAHAGDAPRDDADDWQRSWDEAGGGDIEPTVIAPSALRGPSHEAEAERSSLEQAPDEPQEHSDRVATTDPATADAIASTRAVETRDDAAPTDPRTDEGTAAGGAAAAGLAGAGAGAAAGAAASHASPPELVEPRRPSLSLRGEQRPDLADTAPFEGLAAARERDADAAAARERDADAAAARDDDGAPTQAMPAQEQTAVVPERREEPRFEVDEPVEERRDDEADRLDAARDERTERLGSIPVDDATARAAATGTPIVLVESTTPPRKKGARGVGFLVVLLSTIVFGALLAVVLLGAQYLYDADFVLQESLQPLWLQPSWILPVAVFFVAYWLTTIVVNRAGWWAHVLIGFLVALLAYAAHVAGLFLEARTNVWDVRALVEISGAELGRLLVAPSAILAFVLAREVPIWFGGIVARRGRSAKERNRVALEEYETEQSRRLEEYEASRA